MCYSSGFSFSFSEDNQFLKEKKSRTKQDSSQYFGMVLLANNLMLHVFLFLVQLK